MSGAGDTGPGISGGDNARDDPARLSEPDPPRPVEVHDSQRAQVGNDNTQHNQYGGTHAEAARDAYAALERLRLAAGVLLELAGEPALTDPLEVEPLFNERVEHALLLPDQPAGQQAGRQAGPKRRGWLQPIYGPIT